MARIKLSRRAPNVKRAQIGAATAVLLSLASGSTPVAASGPNIVEQWDKIAEDTVVGTGAPQIEGFVYMSYTQTAVYDALVGIDGTYAPFGPAVAAPAGASRDAAVVEAAVRDAHVLHPVGGRSARHGANGVACRHPRRTGEDRRHRRRTPGGLEHHRAADGRRPADAHRVDLLVPDQDTGSGRLAPDAARLPGAADAVGRDHEAVRAAPAPTDSCRRRRRRSRAPSTWPASTRSR